MKTTKLKKPTDDPRVVTAVDKVNISTDEDHLDPHAKWHRTEVRDQLSGETYAGMKSDVQPRIWWKLVNYMADAIMTESGVRREDIDRLEFADVYDAFREKELQTNNGKSTSNDFWRAVNGVYADYMVTTAKKNFANHGQVKIHPRARSLFTRKEA